MAPKCPTKHANFIVNKGDATARDIEELIDCAGDGSTASTGVSLIHEVRIVGERRQNERNSAKWRCYMGGRSAEREISLMSGNAVLAALQRKGVDAHGLRSRESGSAALKPRSFERVFIALHGRYGEDGTMQGALNDGNSLYRQRRDGKRTGDGQMAHQAGLAWRWEFRRRDFVMLDESSDFDAAVRKLGLPLIVKPVARRLHNRPDKGVDPAQEMPEAYRKAAHHDPMVLAEEFIAGAEVRHRFSATRRCP